MFFLKIQMYLPPSIMVLQTESIILKFKRNTSLPLRLETNKVGDCVCLVIYSKSMGIAYLGHIYLRELTNKQLSDYQSSIEYLIKINNLNSSNSFVALVGAHNLNNLEKIEGILSGFTNIIKVVGGGVNLERSIELSDDLLEVVTIAFSKEKLDFSYEKFEINVLNKELCNKDKIIECLSYHINGRWSPYFPIKLEYSSKEISSINNQLKNPDRFIEVQKIFLSTIEERHNLVFLPPRNSPQKEYDYNANTSMFKVSLALVKNPKITISKPLFHCLIHKPNLFHFIFNYIDLDHANAFDYDTINRFRFPTIQTLIKTKQVSVQAVEQMTKTAEDIFNNDSHRSFLLNNMKPGEILQLKNDDTVASTLSKIDELIANEDISADQLPTFNFKDIEKIYAGEQKGVHSMSSDNILHNGSESGEPVDTVLKEPIYTSCSIM